MTSTLSFNGESPPYIFSTECPWFFWPKEIKIEGKRVITVAGSGDVPLYFLYRDAGSLTAFDVSVHACMWNKLKPLFLQRRDYKSLQTGITALVHNGNTESFWDQIREDYASLRPQLDAGTRAYWDKLIRRNPLKEWLRPTDTILIPLIFYLKSPETFRSLKEKIRPYEIINSPIESAWKTMPGKADIIYCSNICEYLRIMGHSHAVAFLNRLRKALSPDGVIICYETQRASRALENYKQCERNYKIIALSEGVLKPREGFIFRHSLVVLKPG